jgi:hypothetical protein
MNDWSYKLTTEQVSEYKRNGVLIIRGFYDESEINPIKFAIYDIIGLVIKKYDLAIQQKPYSQDNFYSGYLDLIAMDRKLGGIVYDAIKKITPFRRIISSEKNQDVYEQLSGATNTGICPLSQGIRIDNKSEDFYRSLWHQELIFHPQSKDGAVFWSPLIDVSKDMGTIQICLKSHRKGLLQYKENNSDSEKSNNAYHSLCTLDEKASNISNFEVLEPLTKMGDLVVMDYLTVHQSGFNKSNRSRWTLQMRYFNFQDPLGAALGWRGSVKYGVDSSTRDLMTVHTLVKGNNDDR